MAKTRSTSNATTPPAVNTMGIRDFLRGGIYDAETPVTVMRNNVEMGTWYPKGQGVATYYSSTSLGTSAGVPMAGSTVMTLLSTAGTPPVPDNIRSAVAQLHAYLNTDPKEGNDGQEEG